MLEEENTLLRARLGEGPRVETPSEPDDMASGDEVEESLPTTNWEAANGGGVVSGERGGSSDETHMNSYSHQYEQQQSQDSDRGVWGSPVQSTSAANLAHLVLGGGGPHHYSPNASPGFVTPSLSPPNQQQPLLQLSHQQLAHHSHQLNPPPHQRVLDPSSVPHPNLYTLSTVTSTRTSPPLDHTTARLLNPPSYDPNYPHTGTHFWPASYTRNEVHILNPVPPRPPPQPSPIISHGRPDSPTPDEERLFLATSCAIPITELENPTSYHIFCLMIMRGLPITGKGRTGRLSLPLHDIGGDARGANGHDDNVGECCGGLIDCRHPLFEDDAPTSPVPDGYVSALTAWNLVSGIPEETGINISPRDLAALVLDANAPGGIRSVRCERGHGLIVAARAISAVRLVADDLRKTLPVPTASRGLAMTSDEEYDPEFSFVAGMGRPHRDDAPWLPG